VGTTRTDKLIINNQKKLHKKIKVIGTTITDELIINNQKKLHKKIKVLGQQ
jgi:hypothetical protein